MCPRTPADAEQQAVAKEAALLEVVGGGGKGGILVRTGRETSSEELPERLSTGSIVRALESDRGRIYYEMVRGFGPLRGWVSTHVQDKVLLAECGKAGDVQSAEQEEEVKAKMALQMYGDMVACEEVEESQGLRQKQAFPWVSAPVKSSAVVRAELAKELEPEKAAEKSPAVEEGSEKKDLKATFGYPAGTSKDACFARFDVRDDACRRFSGFKHGQVVCYREAPEKEFAVVGLKLDRRSGQERLWLQPQDLSRPGSVMVQPEDMEQLVPVYKGITGSIRKRVTLSAVQASGYEALEDSDGEGVLLCQQCRLPVGTTLYSDKDGNPLHAECMAHHVQRDLRDKEDQLLKKEASEKKATRDSYGIGWCVEHIPLNVGPAQKLSLASAPRGLCCLMLEEGVEGPAVRVLPTVDPACSVNLEYLSLALKVRYTEGREPTFSLDPLVEPGAGPEPSSRMQLKNFEPQWLKGTSVGDVLFQSDYHLKELSMGEYEQPIVGMKSCFDFSEEEGCVKEWNAREWFVVRKAEIQISEDNALIPYLRMAVEAREQVKGKHGLEDVKTTRPNHPLVRYAEAFSHNFELIAERKSVVYHLRELAKASVLAKFLVEADVQLDESWFNLADEPAELCVLEIPQLWNDHIYSQVRVQDGKIVDDGSGFGEKCYSLYGGVQFGLDRFQLSGSRQPARYLSAGLAGRAFQAAPSRYLSAGLATRQFQRSFGPMGIQQASVGARGVDLNLDRFSLSAASGSWDGRVQAEDACANIGRAFWSSITDGSDGALKEEDKVLFRSIFNPVLSDRRDDGDVFAPPDTSLQHMQKLRSLVQEEERLRRERKAHFRSLAFDPAAPGSLYPFSWRATLEVSREAHQSREMCLRTDCRTQARFLERALRSAVPAFDKSTEDGLRFRIYRLGSLEIRTLQDHDGSEAIVAVLSASVREHEQQPSVADFERLAKVTEYVERAANGKDRHSFVVLQTQEGNIVRTERGLDGSIAWEENPEDLDDRNSLAKVIRSAECKDSYTTVQNMKLLLEKEVHDSSGCDTCGPCEAYAQAAYCRALGSCAASGFRKK